MELGHETFRNAKTAKLSKASVLKKVGLGGTAHSRLRIGKGSPSAHQDCLPPSGSRSRLGAQSQLLGQLTSLVTFRETPSVSSFFL